MKVLFDQIIMGATLALGHERIYVVVARDSSTEYRAAIVAGDDDGPRPFSAAGSDPELAIRGLAIQIGSTLRAKADELGGRQAAFAAVAAAIEGVK